MIGGVTVIAGLALYTLGEMKAEKRKAANE
jgi:hypothetical protein